MEIEEILKKYDTDKVNHSYGIAYHDIFNKFDRNANLNILEIGTQKGGSLCAWKDYFPNAKVTGIDIIDVVENKRDDINYIVSDVHDYRTEEEFDIVIDDGSHWLKDVVHSAVYFANRLKENGVMIIEDVQNPEVWISTLTNVLSSQLEYNKYKFKFGYGDFRPIGSQRDDFLFIIERV